MEKVLLTEICKPKQWKTISTSEFKSTGYPVFGANGIIGYYSKYTHEFPTLLITCRGATCGSLNISSPKSYVNGNAMALDNLTSEFDLKYLYYYLSKRGFHDIISGSAQPQITREGLQKIVVTKPKLIIQKQIVARLDKADEIRNYNKQIIKKYDALIQSLFLEMFGDPVKNEKRWKNDILKNICSKITDGTHHSPEPQNEGFPYVTAKHVKNYGLDFYTKPTFISKVDHNEIYKRCSPEYGDILYIKDGATTGIACINTFKEPISLLSSLALLKTNKAIVNNIFLCCWLNNKKVKENYIATFMAGAAIKRYTLAKINKFNLLLPPIELQNQFAERVQKIEAQKQLAQEALIKSEALFNSLLQQSFKS